jgi:hypothetical protein
MPLPEGVSGQRIDSKQLPTALEHDEVGADRSQQLLVIKKSRNEKNSLANSGAEVNRAKY